MLIYRENFFNVIYLFNFFVGIIGIKDVMKFVDIGIFFFIFKCFLLGLSRWSLGRKNKDKKNFYSYDL